MGLTEKEIIEINKDEEQETYFTDRRQQSKFKRFISNSFLHLAIKKGLFYFVVFFIAITMAFFIPRLAHGGHILEYIYTPPAGVSKEAWMEMIAALEKYLGLDKPLYVQYLNFLKNFFTKLDLGYATSRNLQSVNDIVEKVLPYTLMLVIPTLILTFYIGNYIGARAGYTEKKRDKVPYYVFMVLQTAPFFWLGYLFIDIFILELHWFPYSGSVPNWAWNWDVIKTIFDFFWLPFLILLMTNIGGWSTGAFALMTYEKGEDYISYADKLGFRDKTLRQYAFRNSMLPQFTGLNLRFNGLIGATLITEVIFRFPGIGYTMIDAFNKYDYQLIIGLFLVTILVVVLGNYLIDMSYAVLDPRIRVAGRGD